MKQIADILKKYDLRTTKYKKIGKVTIVDTSLGKITLKPKINNNIYDYLDSRGFNYYPKNVINDDEFFITNYLDALIHAMNLSMITWASSFVRVLLSPNTEGSDSPIIPLT